MARTLNGFRFVQTRWNDTLQAVAARELQDASRWADIVNINGLAYPYLTGDPTQASATVKLYGQLILVPAATSQSATTTDPDAIFGTDIALTNGRITATASGDFAVVGGRSNLLQAIKNRISTKLGALVFHLTYGNGAVGLVGKVLGPTSGLLGAQYTKGALLQDPRIQSVISTTATVSGDALEIVSNVQPIAGSSLSSPSTTV